MQESKYYETRNQLTLNCICCVLGFRGAAIGSDGAHLDVLDINVIHHVVLVKITVASVILVRARRLMHQLMLLLHADLASSVRGISTVGSRARTSLLSVRALTAMVAAAGIAHDASHNVVIVVTLFVQLVVSHEEELLLGGFFNKHIRGIPTTHGG